MFFLGLPSLSEFPPELMTQAPGNVALDPHSLQIPEQQNTWSLNQRSEKISPTGGNSSTDAVKQIDHLASSRMNPNRAEEPSWTL